LAKRTQPSAPECAPPQVLLLIGSRGWPISRSGDGMRLIDPTRVTRKRRAAIQMMHRPTDAWLLVRTCFVSVLAFTTNII
jgi:hypothetical protein